MRITTRRVATLAIHGMAVAFLSVAVAGPSDSPPTSSGAIAQPSTEVREKMAKLHEQMAACLRSDKSLAECHASMAKGCRETIGAHGCPMMGMGRGMMQGPPANAPSGK